MIMKPPRGFTLIEVLIAVLIMALGSLSLAALQATSLRNNHQAYLRTQATLLANEIIDRMRTNKAGLATAAYDLAAAAAVQGCTNDSGCSTVEMAQHDLWEWRQSVARLLPDCGYEVCGVVCIDRTASDGSPDGPQCLNDFSADEPVVYAVKIWWNDVAQENNSQRFTMAVQP
jgi:type IV pilus assembly protein PilV